MQTFTSGRDAKEYLVARIVQKAVREGVPLSEIERKMMYFTEAAWTLPDIWEVSEAFDREYDQAAYEEKVRSVAKNAKAHEAATSEIDTWNQAIATMQQEHYLLVLLEPPAGPPSSKLVDRVKLVVTALVICILLLAGILIFSKR